MIERVRAHLKHLPARSPLSPSVVQPTPAEPVTAPEITRIDPYLKQLQDTQPHFPTRLKYLAADGFYSKFKFVSGVLALNLHMIGKLRLDANLRYLYTGPQKPKGARRKYDGKVNLTDLTRFTPVETREPHRKLYTAVVWHVSLKGKIRLISILMPGKFSNTTIPGFKLNLFLGMLSNLQDFVMPKPVTPKSSIFTAMPVSRPSISPNVSTNYSIPDATLSDPLCPFR
jgi:hypothetical protein